MTKPIFVTGHRNPDTDSICSAIAYANLKRELGQEAIACRLGPLNDETKFVLKRFNQENPLLLTDARSQLRDIDMDAPITIAGDATVHEAWDSVLQSSTRSLFIQNEEGKLRGVISTSNLAMLRLLPKENMEGLMQEATLSDIAKTIGGSVIYEPSTFHFSGKVVIVTLSEVSSLAGEIANSLCILSDGLARQKQLMDLGAKVLVITLDESIDPEILSYAKEKGCALISTKKDTMAVAESIHESFKVSSIMTTDLVSYRDDEYVDEVEARMARTRYRSYPVIDMEGHVVGAVSRYHLLNYTPRHFILVDHSAKNQSIANIDQAMIDEIVDHHHIGDIQTTYPIDYRNQKCGCTSTIIANLYQENGLLPNADMSGCMLSAILSDTLNFKSKTTTPLDVRTAQWLAKRAGVEDINAYAQEMLNASVALKDATPSQILNRDLKTYTFGKYHVAIGQTNYSHIEDIQLILPEFKKDLEKEQVEKKLDLLIMMFTHVMAEGTMFVYRGPLSYVLEEIIQTRFDEESGYDHTMISRKQQLVPLLDKKIKAL